jgi:hypothetical protein
MRCIRWERWEHVKGETADATILLDGFYAIRLASGYGGGARSPRP